MKLYLVFLMALVSLANSNSFAAGGDFASFQCNVLQYKTQGSIDEEVPGGRHHSTQLVLNLQKIYTFDVGLIDNNKSSRGDYQGNDLTFKRNGDSVDVFWKLDERSVSTKGTIEDGASMAVPFKDRMFILSCVPSIPNLD